MAESKNNEKQVETRAFLSDEGGVSHELKIEKRGDDLAVFVDPEDFLYDDEILISDEEEADAEDRARILALCETVGANPKTDRLVIIPREDGGWDLAYQAESKAREPAKVLFEEGSDEHLQVERLWMVLGGAKSEDLDREAFGDQRIDDDYPNGRDLATLVHGRKNERVTADDLTETLREIEKTIEWLPGDPGPGVRLVRRLSEVLSSMTTRKAGR